MRNPRRDGDRWIYRLVVAATAAEVLPIAGRLGDLLAGLDDKPLPACPSCSRPTSTHMLGGKRLPAGELGCGVCGHRWAATSTERSRVAALWSARVKLTSAAVRCVLPRSVSRGEVLAPPAADLEGWARMGIADAILGRPPAHVPTPTSPPWAYAYAWGWSNAIAVATATRGSTMNSSEDNAPNTHDPTDPTVHEIELHEYDPTEPAAEVEPVPLTQSIDFSQAGQELFDALAEAQALVASASKGGWNEQNGYSYAGTDDMTRASHDPLRAAGLSLITAPSPVWDHEVLGQFSQATMRWEKPGQCVVGQVRVEWHLLLHGRGRKLSRSCQRISGLTFAPIIAASFRPPDKALAGASSYTRTYVIRDLLNIDRGNDPDADVDQRSVHQREAEQQQQRRPQPPRRQQQQRRPQRPRRQQQQHGDRVKQQQQQRGQQRREQQQAEADLGPWLTDEAKIEEINAMVSQLAMLRGSDNGTIFAEALDAMGVPKSIESKGKTYAVDRAKRLRVSQARMVSAYLDDKLGEAEQQFAEDSHAGDEAEAEAEGVPDEVPGEGSQVAEAEGEGEDYA